MRFRNWKKKKNRFFLDQPRDIRHVNFIHLPKLFDAADENFTQTPR